MANLPSMESRHPGTVIDRSFIEGNTAGYAEYKTNLEVLSWDDVVERCFVERKSPRDRQLDR